MSEEKPDNEVEIEESPAELKASLLSATLPSYKYFIDPFAVGGDLQPIPDTPPVGGQVNYTTGFGSNYSLNYLTDPSALAVPRKGMNQLFNDITTVLQEYQQWGTPVFITSAQNGGVPFPYSKNAFALYDPGTGPQVYQSLADNNTALPTDDTMWIEVTQGGDADIAAIQSLAYNFVVATGTANAITVNPTPAYNPVVSPGASLVYFRAIAANTGATTINVSGNGAVNLLKQTVGAGQIALAGGEIQSGVDYAVFINSGSALLINPSPLSTDAVTPTQLRNQTYTVYTAGGTANAITVSPAPAYPTFVTSTQITLLISANNTGATTLTVGAVLNNVVKKVAGGGTEALSGGELISGTLATFFYNGTDMELQNPLAYGMQYLEARCSSSQTVNPLTLAGINFNTVVTSPSPIIILGAVGFPNNIEVLIAGRFKFSFNVTCTTSLASSPTSVYIVVVKGSATYRVFGSEVNVNGDIISISGSFEENCAAGDSFGLSFSNNATSLSIASVAITSGTVPQASTYFQCTYLGAI